MFKILRGLHSIQLNQVIDLPYESMMYIIENNPELQSLLLTDSYHYTTKILNQLFGKCQHLTELQVEYHSEYLTVKDVRNMADVNSHFDNKLCKLRLRRMINLTADDVIYILERFTYLSLLDVQTCGKLDKQLIEKYLDDNRRNLIEIEYPYSCM